MKELDKQLISEYARREGIPYQESERRIKSFIDTIRDVLMLTSRVNLRRLGAFYIKTRKSAYRNQHTGITERIPLIKAVGFKPAKSLKQEVRNITSSEIEKRFRN
jgi:nucleoid DNA-binding protein